MTISDDTAGNSSQETGFYGSLDEGASALANLLSRKPQANPQQDGDDEEPDPAEADDGDDYIPSTDDDVEEGAEAEADDDAEAPDDDEPVRYRLKDGTEVTEADIEEWRKGNLRQADYTRKTQELAETRKAAEKLQAEATQRATEFSERLDLVIKMSEALLPPEPDEQLLAEDPIRFFQEQRIRERKIKELQGLQEAKKLHDEEVQKQQRDQFQKWAAQESQRVLEVLPKLKDEKQRNAFTKDLKTYLPQYGYTEADLASVYDHRLVRVIHDAVQWRKLEANRSKVQQKVKDVPPPAKPGKRASPAEITARSQKEAMDRLRRTGSEQDAAAVLLARMKGK